MGWFIFFVIIIFFIILMWEYIEKFLLVLGIVVIFLLIISYAISYFDHTRISQIKCKIKISKISRIKRKNEKDKVHLEKIYHLSRLGKSLDEINEKYNFYNTNFKMQHFCSNKKEYDNYSIVDFFKENFKEIEKKYKELTCYKEKNEITYEMYKGEFLNCQDYSTKTEIKQIKKHLKISSKRIIELEKELNYKKIKNINNSISIDLTIYYMHMLKTIKCEDEEIKKILIEVKNDIDYNYVCSNSFLYEEIIKLNNLYTFNEIDNLKDRGISCNNYNNYVNFNIKNHIKKELKVNDDFRILYSYVYENNIKYNLYEKEYSKLTKFYQKENQIVSLQNLEMSVDDFRRIENKIYTDLKLKKPIIDFNICYYINYTSPAGRSNYTRKEYLSYTELGELISETPNQKIELLEKELKRTKNLLRKKELLLNKLPNREKVLAKKEKELITKERNLMYRIKEFEIATKGHIYNSNENVINYKKNNNEENLNKWEKLQKIKRKYEDGEISYDEYKEERDKLF